LTQIKVTLADDQTLIARLVAHDPTTDLAVIKVDAARSLPVIVVGTSSDLMPGEEVIAVGNAYGYMHTVTRGIISALHRTVQVSDEQQYQDLIQTDASINPGNSGGPLLNIDGEMIGINVAVRVGAQGIGFALPVDQAMDVAAKLLSLQQSAASGVTGKTEFQDRQPYFVVTGVAEGSAGEAAGLHPGDIITRVGDYGIQRSLDWQRATIDLPAGETLDVHTLRDQETLSVSLVLTELRGSSTGSENLVWQTLGLRLTPVDGSTLASVGDSRYRGGLQVTAVRPDGPAAQRGVRRGDILVGMHKWETISLDNVTYILNSAEFRTSQPTKFFVIRGAETLYGHMRVSFGGE
jgi:serine protease Do